MNDLEERLIELEVKTAWQDDLLSELNRQIIQMRDMLDIQQAQLRLLYQRQNPHAAASDSDQPYSLFEERPPHY